MPRLIITAGAVTGLERCRTFLTNKNPSAARNAAGAIKRYFELVTVEPHMGRPLEDLPELRELVIPFGGAGYVALYRFDILNDTVYVLAFRHQREAGY